jgi:hypothetical protein
VVKTLDSLYMEENCMPEEIIERSLNRRDWPARLRAYDGSTPPSHLRTKVKSFWTSDHLYFIFRCHYETLRMAFLHEIRTDESGKTLNLWDISDVCETFIGPDVRHAGSYREFQVAPDSRWIDIAIDASGPQRFTDFTWRSGMAAGSQIFKERRLWFAAMKIPFTAFDRSPRADDIWDANLYRISHHPRGNSYLAWSPVGEIAFHQPDKFGKIRFAISQGPARL